MATEFNYTREWTDAEAFPLLSFTKNWENPEDYPTYEPDEMQVRKDMQSLHDEVKDFLNNELIPRVIAEDATVEGWEAQETARSEAESARSEAETARADAEQGRVDAEAARVQTEAARVETEAARATAESARVTAETGRVEAEAARVTAEQNRATVESARVTAEAARAAAESARVTAEANRESAESGRAAAEAARSSAETARSGAEAKRVSAEQARVSAEKARADAESARTSEFATLKTNVEAATNSANTAADKVNKMTVSATDLTPGSAATVTKGTNSNGGIDLKFGIPEGAQGKTGNGIKSINKTGGTGAAGTYDTYTITMTDGSTFNFRVLNGANGKDGDGTGDMLANIYDPTEKKQDIFAYADKKLNTGINNLADQFGVVVGTSVASNYTSKLHMTPYSVGIMCRENDVTKGAVFVLDGQVRIEGLAKPTTDDMPADKGYVDNAVDMGFSVPDFWLEELDAKADAIRSAMESAGRTKSAFLWYTDSHWTYGNSKMSPTLLKYLWKYTPMNKVNFGGDIVVNAQDREKMAYLYAEWRSAIRGLPNHHSVVGNHDVMVDYPYAFLIAPEESADMVMGGDLYYYIDNPCEQTRYIYLDTGRQSGSDEEAAWLIDTLNSVPPDWHVVVISHVWFQYTSTSAPTVGKIPAYAQKVLNVLDAYNARGSGSVTMVSAACEYNFSNAVGAVEFCIGGHIHVDYDFTSSGGIPVILTASDVNQDRSADETEDSGTIGTITESAVFGIVANYVTREVSVIGVGRGGSRIVALKPKAEDEKYTNQITISTDTDGSVYNVIGYADDTRLNSSGATQAATSSYKGLDCTGFIPVKVGDVVRMQGMETRPDSSLASSSRFAFYNANKTFIALQTLNNLGAQENAERYNTVIDADGYLTQFTVPSAIINTDISAAAYMRISVVGITEDSIITVNEPIE